MFTVVIVNYKSGRYLDACLGSLEKAFGSVPGFEAVIVNADGDPSARKHSARSFIRVIDSPVNGGFGFGSNLGARMSGQDILFFLNPDTDNLAIDPGAIAERFRNEPDLGALSVRLVGSDGYEQPWSFGPDATLLGIIGNNLGLVSEGMRSDGTVDWASGTALFVRRTLFERIGGFDEGFFMYFEDADLCRRIRQSGSKVILAPEYSVTHHGGGSYEACSREQKHHYYASQDRYFKKYRPKMEGALLKILRKAQL